jgi:hypothetical protein
MKKRWAFLTILAALVLGAGGGFLFGHLAQPAMQMSLSCMLASEAEKAGYLDKQKRAALIDRLSQSKSLDADARQSVASLKGACP